ncbi:MAG TPA: glycosyltransferase, partial [Pyrinomonadaceae bacterium]|nr:glycosyltransferase [Pyrinomonadaceae bacterium]
MTRPQPFFSVVVPTRARPAQLAACLDALARQEYPRERFEVVVVNDGGPEPSEVFERFAGRLDATLVTQKHAGPAAARNTGARRARAPFLAFTDDDCRPDPVWLKALEARLRDAPGAAVGGRTVNALPRNLFSTASQSLTEYLYEYFDAAEGRAAFFTSNNLALSSELFRAVGGFDESFPLAAGEDRELCDRWRARGHRLTYAPDAVVRHAHALTLRSFCRQHFN